MIRDAAIQSKEESSVRASRGPVRLLYNGTGREQPEQCPTRAAAVLAEITRPTSVGGRRRTV